jgi:hypothetical protein
MENIRVHPKGFKFLFFLYHGSAAVGFILVTGFLLKVVPYDISFFIGILMISIPFLLVPPELIVVLKDQKLIFRHGINCTTIPFKNILQVKTSACSVKIKDFGNNTLLEIHKEHFKNINLSELSEYIVDLLSGRHETDNMKYSSVKFTGCRFFEWCKSGFVK